jgi:hypothetical protein
MNLLFVEAKYERDDLVLYYRRLRQFPIIPTAHRASGKHPRSAEHQAPSVRVDRIFQEARPQRARKEFAL